MAGGGDFLASRGDLLVGGGDFSVGGGDGVGSDLGSEDDSVRSIGSETFAFFFRGPIPYFLPLKELAPAMVSDLLVL